MIIDDINKKPCSEDFVGGPVTSEQLKSMAKSFDSSPLVSTKELAETLGLTPRRVTQLVEEGFLLKKGRNQFNLFECLHNYVLYQRRVKIKEAMNLDS